MSAPDQILALVTRFGRHDDRYRWPTYNETELRREFIAPFFKALGWDVDNEQGCPEAYRDVVHGHSINVGACTKAPAYSFRIGGVRKFFVETKRPAVSITHDVSPAFQLRRYAWSAKLPLSILTDFGQLAVYDCRVRPHQNDPPSTARTLHLKYDQYVDCWDDIAGIFSRPAVLGGSPDKYAGSVKSQRGTAEVDDALLAEIEQWRSGLAHNLAVRNPELSQRELNFAVQKTIDRVVFLRICEDRGLETYGRLQALPDGPHIYPRLCALFRQADDRYNSGLFHFTPAKEGTGPSDEWTLSLNVDDHVLQEIIRKLYYPESPYEFSVLGSDILGQVYERFLGKVIRLTPGQRAVVEDKPEVKKAGGVYYTPTYIVDYIVKHTVGKLLEGKTPYQAAARTRAWRPSQRGRPLTVLDPACGSGSFLIGAYQYLLDWYRDWYVGHDPAAHQDRISRTRTGRWRLTTDERRRILLDHIYGVDIDPQAVEVTKLSLLLKVLEGETGETLQRPLFAKQRALPDLSDNIKCGNALIGPEFFENRQPELAGADQWLRINAFDWESEFPDILDTGGFDAVIGNPPYLKEYTNRQVFRDLKRARLAKYYVGKMDLWYVFACLAVDLLKEGGRHSFIATNNWTTNAGAKQWRRKLRTECQLEAIVDFGAFMAFDSASVQTMIYVARKGPGRKAATVPFTRVTGGSMRTSDVRLALAGDADSDSVERFDAHIPDTALDGPFTFVNDRCRIVLEKMASAGRLRLQPDEIAQGIVPNPDVVSRRSFGKLPTSRVRELALNVGDPVFVVPRGFFPALDQRESPFLKPTYEPAELDRYFLPEQHTREMIYLTRANDPGDLAAIEAHLSQYREIMEARRENQLGRIEFKHLHWPRDEAFFDGGPKLLCVRKCQRPVCVYTEAPAYVMMAINVIRTTRLDLKFLCALLNSRLTYFWLDQSGKKQGDQLQVDKEPLTRIPLLHPEDGARAEPGKTRRIVELVEEMIRLHGSAASARDAQGRATAKRQIAATDRRIDQLVYGLYGLTDEDIRIVEKRQA